MAIKPVDNETFYREVDEELRREQLQSWWKRYGKLVIGGVVLVLAAIAGVIWWQNQKQAKAGERGEQLIAAFDDITAGNKAAATPKLDQLAKSGSPGYRAAALMTQADLAIEANQIDRAASLFRQIADDDAMAEPYRHVALVRATALEFDKLPPQQVIDRLKPLAVPGNAFFGSAGEMVAISYLKLNRSKEAAALFAAMVKDKKLPDSLRTRALQMAGSLGVDAIQDPPAGEGQEGTQ